MTQFLIHHLEFTAVYGLNLHGTQINTWKKQTVALLPDIFSDKNKQQATSHDVQLSELYEQIGRLKVENDFLKKKSEVFGG